MKEQSFGEKMLRIMSDKQRSLNKLDCIDQELLDIIHNNMDKATIEFANTSSDRYGIVDIRLNKNFMIFLSFKMYTTTTCRDRELDNGDVFFQLCDINIYYDNGRSKENYYFKDYHFYYNNIYTNLNSMFEEKLRKEYYERCEKSIKKNRVKLAEILKVYKSSMKKKE